MTTTPLTQAADIYDELLLKIVREGVPLTDAAGNPVLVDGKPVMGPPSAAMLNVIRGRLKDCGITSDASQSSSPIAKIATHLAAAQKGAKLPRLSDDDDAAVA